MFSPLEAVHLDSQVTWPRIQSDPNKHELFVEDKIRKIQRTESAIDWLYLRTEQNPADLVSRSLSFRLKHKWHTWFHGPTAEAIQQSESEIGDTTKMTSGQVESKSSHTG